MKDFRGISEQRFGRQDFVVKLILGAVVNQITVRFGVFVALLGKHAPLHVLFKEMNLDILDRAKRILLDLNFPLALF